MQRTLSNISNLSEGSTVVVVDAAESRTQAKRRIAKKAGIAKKEQSVVFEGACPLLLPEEASAIARGDESARPSPRTLRSRSRRRAQAQHTKPWRETKQAKAARLKRKAFRQFGSAGGFECLVASISDETNNNYETVRAWRVEFRGRSEFAKACQEYAAGEREWSDVLMESNASHWIDWTADEVAGKPVGPDLLRKLAETLWDELPREVLDILEKGERPPLGAGIAWVRGLAPNPSPDPAPEPETELELEALRAARLKRLDIESLIKFDAAGGKPLGDVDEELSATAA